MQDERKEVEYTKERGGCMQRTLEKLEESRSEMCVFGGVTYFSRERLSAPGLTELKLGGILDSSALSVALKKLCDLLVGGVTKFHGLSCLNYIIHSFITYSLRPS